MVKKIYLFVSLQLQNIVPLDVVNQEGRFALTNIKKYGSRNLLNSYSFHS